jgi:hypothetical protein
LSRIKSRPYLSLHPTAAAIWQRILEAYVTWMLEVFYAAPTDPAREARLLEVVRGHGGRLDSREAPEVNGLTTYV